MESAEFAGLCGYDLEKVSLHLLIGGRYRFKLYLWCIYRLSNMHIIAVSPYSFPSLCKAVRFVAIKTVLTLWMVVLIISFTASNIKTSIQSYFSYTSLICHHLKIVLLAENPVILIDYTPLSFTLSFVCHINWGYCF